jgi:carbon monoxide dehydrogenase subunit G
VTVSRTERSVHVEAPPERVWAFVSDVRRCPEWVAFTDGMGHVDDGDPGVGFRYTEYGSVGPLRSESEWRIVEFDPPRRQVHVGDMGIVDGEPTIAVEPEDGGTRWTRTVELEVLPRLRPVERLLDRLVLRRRMARGLERTMAAGRNS